MTKRYIAYYRVSTQQQGRSGLGLDAQRSIVSVYKPVREYTEVESGKRNERPELLKALADCKRSGATLVIAKLDRLSRNTKFLLTLIENDADVLFCDLPNIPSGAMGKFLLTQMAAVAELEAGLISERTKAALAECKKRGMKLGSARDGAYRLKGGYNPRAVAAAGVRNAELARQAYDDVVPVVKSLLASGDSLRSIAKELNASGVLTRRGSEWTGVQVGRVLKYG